MSLDILLHPSCLLSYLIKLTQKTRLIGYLQLWKCSSVFLFKDKYISYIALPSIGIFIMFVYGSHKMKSSLAYLYCTYWGTYINMSICSSLVFYSCQIVLMSLCIHSIQASYFILCMLLHLNSYIKDFH